MNKCMTSICHFKWKLTITPGGPHSWFLLVMLFLQLNRTKQASLPPSLSSPLQPASFFLPPWVLVTEEKPSLQEGRLLLWLTTDSPSDAAWEVWDPCSPRPRGLQAVLSEPTTRENQGQKGMEEAATAPCHFPQGLSSVRFRRIMSFVS